MLPFLTFAGWAIGGTLVFVLCLCLVSAAALTIRDQFRKK